MGEGEGASELRLGAWGGVGRMLREITYEYGMEKGLRRGFALLYFNRPPVGTRNMHALVKATHHEI